MTSSSPFCSRWTKSTTSRARPPRLTTSITYTRTHTHAHTHTHTHSHTLAPPHFRIGHPNFEIIRHDVIKPILLEVDQIYHLACPASPPHYQYNPIKTIKTNTMGTPNMLGLARRVKARLLMASTSEIYGELEYFNCPLSSPPPL